jgi:hypothetical protein
LNGFLQSNICLYEKQDTNIFVVRSLRSNAESFFNIFALFGGRVFQQTIGIPMGTICAPLFANLFLHTYDADFFHGFQE